jgi:hypothetical protein
MRNFVLTTVSSVIPLNLLFLTPVNAQQPALADACKNYATAIKAINSGSVPLMLRAAANQQFIAQGKMCDNPPPSKVDAKEVQDAADLIATKAAEYVQEIKP